MSMPPQLLLIVPSICDSELCSMGGGSCLVGLVADFAPVPRGCWAHLEGVQIQRRPGDHRVWLRSENQQPPTPRSDLH